MKFVKILLERNVASPNYINNEEDLVMALRDYCRSLEDKIDEVQMNYDNEEEFDIIYETLLLSGDLFESINFLRLFEDKYE